MASRRDELNAYTFARKRMVGAFLQPSGGGNDEDAPRPVRAVLPSVVVSALVVAGFGMWGVLKPSAPLNWDSGKNIIQGKQSTTRYVVLIDPKSGDKVLHQVLNMSSARLVLPAGAPVVIVADDVLDKYKRHGATIGIQYAPDRLPKDTDAGQTKKWSVCDRPGTETNKQASINQAVFIAAGDEAKTLEKPEMRLGDGQSLFVQGPPVGSHPASKFLVDGQGRRHAVGVEATSGVARTALENALFGPDPQAQQVTDEWMRTLEDGEPITFPKIPGFDAAKAVPSNVQLSQQGERKVGRLLKFQDTTYYVVGVDRLYQVTHFQAELIRNNPELKAAYGDQTPKYADLTPFDKSALQSKLDKSLMDDAKGLPGEPSPAVNIAAKGARSVVCSTFDGIENNAIKRSVWAHTEYPVQVASGSASAHVTPGHGLLYRAFDGAVGDSSGSDFLITETGLRYSLPANDDGAAAQAASAGAPAGVAASGAPQQPGEKKEANEAQARLGYKAVTPAMVPAAWSKLVPAGPPLNTNTALQAQNA